MIPTHQNVHNRFKLNGFSMDKDDLCRVAYVFIKEGEPFEQPVGDFILDWFSNNPYLEMKTSGTTGEPKIIKISKKAMINSALATGDYFGLKPGDKALHCLPVEYVAGKMMLIRGFILGLELDFVAPNSNPLHRNTKKYDFAAMVPMQAQHSLNHLHQIKKIIIGGAKVNQPLINDLMPIKSEIYETYGMTETITHIAAKRIGEKNFQILPNVMISTDDRSCLVLHAPKISDEVITTNDIVEIVDSEHFNWIGRYDNVINSGGIKLFPEQIEEKLISKINQRFYITAKDDQELGQKIVVVVEGEPFEINEDIFSALGKYEKPKEIIFKPEFKTTATGKIIREF